MFDLESTFINDNNDLGFIAPEISDDFSISVSIQMTLTPIDYLDLDLEDVAFIEAILKTELNLLGSDAISIDVAKDVIDLKVKLPFNLSSERLYRSLENRLQASYLMHKKTPIFFNNLVVKSLAG
jgi:hypothetical protein